MLKYLFLFLLLCHSLIHLRGFVRNIGITTTGKITKPLSNKKGKWWLLASVLFIITATGFIFKTSWWPFVAIVAVCLSQTLIVKIWNNAKFGTLPNLIVLLAVVSVWGNHQFESGFIHDVKVHLKKNILLQNELITERDLVSLPAPVQKYLRYAGAVGRPRPYNMRLTFEGEMRGKDIDWFPLNSLQYNFFDSPTRLFFIRGKMYGLQVPGYHNYQNGKDRMDIKLFGLIPVIHQEGPELDRTETVTYFSDLCLFAPAALTDKRISWTSIDSHSVRAIFKYGANKISATLIFNDRGQLINFISDDRSPIDEKKPVRFSTPVKDYKTFDGRNIPTSGEAIWHYPDQDFVYGRFSLKSIEYNVPKFK
jgi:hypothetical protein